MQKGQRRLATNASVRSRDAPQSRLEMLDGLLHETDEMLRALDVTGNRLVHHIRIQHVLRCRDGRNDKVQIFETRANRSGMMKETKIDGTKQKSGDSGKGGGREM